MDLVDRWVFTICCGTLLCGVVSILAVGKGTQRLMQLLNQSAGDGLKGAAASAAKGDPSALTGLLRQVMQSKEGAQLVQRINQAVPEDKR